MASVGSLLIDGTAGCMNVPVTVEELSNILSGFERAKVAVVGDYFLDRYLVTDPSLAERSIETGLTAHQVVGVRNNPGAAGTIVNNLVAMGAGEIHAVGVVGDDGYGFELRRALTEQGVNTHRLIISKDRFTPTYVKPMREEDGVEREMERFDIQNRQPLPAPLQQAVIEALQQVVPQVDAVIVLDQVEQADCGVVTESVRNAVTQLAAVYPGKPFLADSRAFIGKFHGVIIKPNHAGATRASAAGEQTPLEEIGRTLFERTRKPVLITCGERGIMLIDQDAARLIPGCPVKGPIDVTGAGDSATAAITLSLCSGAPLPQAAYIGNLAASITVQQLGTTGTANRQQIAERLSECLQNGDA